VQGSHPGSDIGIEPLLGYLFRHRLPSLLKIDG